MLDLGGEKILLREKNQKKIESEEVKKHELMSKA